MHTPGPWKMNKQRHHSRKAWQWVLDSPTRGGMAIAEVDDLSAWALKNRPHLIPEHEETLAEVEANCRLIAAAPELLAALQKLIGEYESFIYSEYDGTDKLEGALEEIEYARIALTKATKG